MNQDVGAVIAAAGKGERLGGVAKAFLSLAGQPLIYWVLRTFREHPSIGPIVLVVSPENLTRADALIHEQSWSNIQVVTGGPRRQDSVANGLRAMGSCEWVIIHDGARPLVTPKLIDMGLEAAKETGAAVAATPVIDTIKVSRDSFVLETLPRKQLRAAQTPQVFRSDIITEAYSQIEEDITDDASLVEKMGYQVKLYPGSYDNIKITTQSDLLVAQILAERSLL